MLLCPLQNTALQRFLSWLQIRPLITQHFGENPDIYAKFGMKGHNGIDLRARVGTPARAPCDGRVTVKKDPGGYGLHIRIRSFNREVILAHLSKVFVKDGERVRMGNKIALTGNTGFSSGPHLHLGYREIVPSEKPIGEWGVKNLDNGYMGSLDITKYIVTWKGTLLENNL